MYIYIYICTHIQYTVEINNFKEKKVLILKFLRKEIFFEWTLKTVEILICTPPHTHTHTHIYIEGVHGVMATIEGNGHSDISSNPGRDCILHTSLEKGMNLIILPPAMGK